MRVCILKSQSRRPARPDLPDTHAHRDELICRQSPLPLSVSPSLPPPTYLKPGSLRLKCRRARRRVGRRRCSGWRYFLCRLVRLGLCGLGFPAAAAAATARGGGLRSDRRWRSWLGHGAGCPLSRPRALGLRWPHVPTCIAVLLLPRPLRAGHCDIQPYCPVACHRICHGVHASGVCVCVCVCVCVRVYASAMRVTHVCMYIYIHIYRCMYALAVAPASAEYLPASQSVHSALPVPALNLLMID